MKLCVSNAFEKRDVEWKNFIVLMGAESAMRSSKKPWPRSIGSLYLSQLARGCQTSSFSCDLFCAISQNWRTRIEFQCRAGVQYHFLACSEQNMANMKLVVEAMQTRFWQSVVVGGPVIRISRGWMRGNVSKLLEPLAGEPGGSC